MLYYKHKEEQMASKKEKPNWLDIANLIISFGLLVVAILALILK